MSQIICEFYTLSLQCDGNYRYMCTCTRAVLQLQTYVCVGNKWVQQQIPACRPVFTAKHVFVLFLSVGIIFLILGIVFVTTTVRVCTCNMLLHVCTCIPPEVPWMAHELFRLEFCPLLARLLKNWIDNVSAWVTSYTYIYMYVCYQANKDIYNKCTLHSFTWKLVCAVEELYVLFWS